MSDRLPWWRVLPWEFVALAVVSLVLSATVDRAWGIGLLAAGPAVGLYSYRRARESRLQGVGRPADARSVNGPIWARALVLVGTVLVSVGAFRILGGGWAGGVVMLVAGVLALLAETYRERREAYRAALRAVLDERTRTDAD